MTTETFCGAPNCAKPTDTGTLCPDCHHELTALVDNLPWALTQLQYAATNQTRFTISVGARSQETPLAFNPRASAELAAFAANVQLWQGRLADHQGMPVRFTNPVKAAKWLADHLTTIRTYINAGQMLDSLAYTFRSVEAVINRPPPSQYLGDCTSNENGHTCPGRMYAFPGKPEARCDTCGTTKDAEALRLTLLTDLDSRSLTAAEIATTAAYMDLPFSREQVRKKINRWHNKQRISPTGTEHGDPKFNFGTVRRLLEEDVPEKATA
jgi:hypothetical protein